MNRPLHQRASPPPSPDVLMAQLDALEAIERERLGASSTLTQRAFDTREQASRAEVADERRVEDVEDEVDDIASGALADIVAAKRRLALGCYGLCTTCGKEIPAARLLFHPAAARCVECQRALEG